MSQSIFVRHLFLEWLLSQYDDVLAGDLAPGLVGRVYQTAVVR